jgi:hypothetical protein
MKLVLVALIAVGAACSPPVRHDHAREPRGWAGHHAAAERHEQRAEAHERAARHAESSGALESYRCGDTGLYMQSTSGTESVSHTVPCWNVHEEAALRHRTAAREHRLAAREDRVRAARLARVERAYCQEIPEAERGHSPFAHRAAIAEVLPHRQAGELRGVRIVFDPIPGLTAAYLERAIACNRARFAVLGEPADFMPEDPTLVAGAEVVVVQQHGHVEVVVRTADDVAAAVALSRARELVDTRTATR